MYGTTGSILRVDLTNEKVSEEKIGDEIFKKYLTNEGFMYPLDDYRKQMPSQTFQTTNTSIGLFRMAISDSFIIRIPTIRKHIGGLDYANMPFKSLLEWKEELCRFYMRL